MQEEKKLKQPTRIYFDVVGEVEFKQEDFFPNKKSTKPNSQYIYSILNLTINQNNMKHKIYLNSGGSPQNKIYARNNKNESMVINFTDRGNEEIIKQVSTLNLFQVGLNKIDTPKTRFNEKTNELEVVLKTDGTPEMIKTWNFQNYLTEYDLINFLGQNLKSGQRVRMTGEITLNKYEGKIQKKYKLNKIYLLSENENFEDRFLLKVETLVDKNSLNESAPIIQEDNKYKVKLNTKIFHQVNKNKREVFPLEIFYIYEDETKGRKLIEKLFKVDGDTIRKVILECHLFNGKVYSQAEESEIEITQELKELAEAMGWKEHEILEKAQPKKYSNIKYVEEIIIDKPFFIEQDGKISLAIDDVFYNKEDLTNLEIIDENLEIKKDKNISNINDDDLGLNDTENNVFDDIVNTEDDDLPF